VLIMDDSNVVEKETVCVDEPYQGFIRRPFSRENVKPRIIQFDFPDDIPKHWVGGNATKTHVMNSLNLFISPFERMIMRTVLHTTIPMLDDEELIGQARGYVAQEGTHAKAHDAFLINLRQHGYNIERYLKFVDWFFGTFLEKKVSHSIALSVVASFEHYTDLLVRLVLKEDYLDDCEPRMKELIQWHAAEEAEHCSVPFELLKAVDDRYWVRMVGNVAGLAVILGFMICGSSMLLFQDRKLFKLKTMKEFGSIFFSKYRLAYEIVRLFKDYSRRNYESAEIKYTELAKGVLDGVQESVTQEPITKGI